MNYLARKISRGRWGVQAWMAASAIRADAVTLCLKTEGDTLSVWECSEDRADVAEVILALATNFQRLDTVDVVLLDSDELQAAGVELEATAGLTPVDDLKYRHRDLARLDMDRLSAVATQVAIQVRGDVRCHRFTKREVRDIVRDAVGRGRVRKELLQPKVAEEI